MESGFSLKGKVALVTGGSRGIGWAITRALAEAGAHVVVNGRNPQVLDARVAELAAAGLSGSAAAFDVGDEAAVARAVEQTVERHGHLDIAIANAGINQRFPLTDFATADFRRVFEVNLDSYFVLAREAAKPMIRQGGGRLIVVASMMGQIARPGIAAYVASKGGATALTKALAVELGEHGITCNAICPGFTRTDMTQLMQDNAEFTEWVEGRTPLKRWADPSEVAAVAVFLASDAASYVTGHSLNVDGGFAISV